ncbi:MAG: GntR family transcriptional regulator [Gemmatimonadota bacterium]|nr:GntR family transcriptional regulator [Gemmatimonadota bacterium]
MVPKSYEITGKLRDRILADLHAGRIDPDDRLPSIRSLADEMEADHRTIARAYRSLEEEGLVEVRARSGVYVAPQDHLGREGTMLEETAEWMAEIAAGAWTRRIRLEELPDLVRRCVAHASVRCVVVESVEDARAIWSRELSDDFGLEVDAVPVSVGYDSLPAEETHRVEDALREADFVVTSVYHAHAIEEAAAPSGTPLAILRYAPRWLEEVRRRLSDAPDPLVIALDPEGTRRRIESTELAERLRMTSVEAWDGTVPAGTHAYCTVAAAERLGEKAPPALGLPGPSLSPDSARAVCDMIVRASLGREEACVTD